MTKPVIEWFKEHPLADNFEKVGRTLATHLPGVVHDENGLILLENGRTRRIDSAAKLSPFLIDNVNLKVWSEPDRKGDRKRVERLTESTLRDMLGSRTFLRNFPKVQDITTTPVVLADETPSRPGHNPGGILYTGPVVEIASGLDTINRFLDVIEFDCNASRTNAVAAALTVLWRHHWCGAKPLIQVTANKSHSGKGTVCKFIAGNCAHVDLSYQSTQWAMETTLQSQLSECPEAGLILFDNVRLTRYDRVIKSQLFESFITNSDIILAVPKLKRTFRSPNKYVVMLNTNEGELSPDLLNRSLPINLNCTGDLQERLVRAKAKLGGMDVKTEWLPANLGTIQAELWYMVAKWLKEGKPLATPKAMTAQYPMAPWAKTIGGILMVNGFVEFLGNYGRNRIAADPIRKAIGHLAFYASHNAKSQGEDALSSRELGAVAVREGLGGILLKGVEGNLEVKIGHALAPYVGESFTASTATKVITYRLDKRQRRWTEGSDSPSNRYVFTEIDRQDRTEQGGVELEEPFNAAAGIAPDQKAGQPAMSPAPAASATSALPGHDDLELYHPEPIPAFSVWTAGPEDGPHDEGFASKPVLPPEQDGQDQTQERIA